MTKTTTPATVLLVTISKDGTRHTFPGTPLKLVDVIVARVAGGQGFSLANADALYAFGPGDVTRVGVQAEEPTK